MQTNLVFIMGSACVGKTTLGRQLAKELKYMFLDSETFSTHYTKELSKLHGFDENDRDSPAYLQHIKPIEAKVTYSLVAENLKLGVSIIIPTVLLSLSKQKDWVHQFLAEHNIEHVSIKVIELLTLEETLLYKQIQQRNHPQDKWKLNNWAAYYPTIQDYCVAWEKVDKLTYDNTHFTSLDDIELFKRFILETPAN